LDEVLEVCSSGLTLETGGNVLGKRHLARGP